MSYEIIRGIKIKNNQVFIKSDSNNVTPKTFEYRFNNFFTKLYNENIEEFNYEILLSYEEGNFQEGLPNKWSKAIKRLMDLPIYHESYSWRNGNYYEKNNLINENRKSNDFKLLLLNSLKLKPKKLIVSINNSLYVKKFTKTKIYYTYDINDAKIFETEFEIISRLSHINDYKIISKK